MLLSSCGFWRAKAAGDASRHGTEQRALQTEAVGLQLHGSKVPPCRLKFPWGQRSPLSLRGVCLWDHAPWSWVPAAAGRAQRDRPGAESGTFLCNDLTKGSATSVDSSCGLLVFQPTCSLRDVDNNHVLYLK